jgi:hypothetical protein
VTKNRPERGLGSIRGMTELTEGWLRVRINTKGVKATRVRASTAISSFDMNIFKNGQ